MKLSNIQHKADLLVLSATPGGIMTAIAAARMGRKVHLAEYHAHPGGMTSSGLGKSDIENRNAIAGLFQEFIDRVKSHYLLQYGPDSIQVDQCKDGYYYEPSVAEKVFTDMMAEEASIQVFYKYAIQNVNYREGKIESVDFLNRNTGDFETFIADAFADASYEGDLYALAGESFRLGREGKEDFGESLAGHIFYDYHRHRILEGSTGKGDHRIPAYTYRLCLTDDPSNGVALEHPPSDYQRETFLPYLDDLKEGRLGPPAVFKEGHGYYPDHFNTLLRAFSFTEIPNRKFDVNINPRPLAFPFPEENYTYPTADWQERERVAERHRNLCLGLLYFVQNDEAVPEAHRKMAGKYFLPKDEFTDNGHFPWQLYVREARRLHGQYTLTENDVSGSGIDERNTIFEDSIISGEFPIDSFPLSREVNTNKIALEGYIGMREIKPYQVPLRIMLPQFIENLIVPVAASTSHIAYSTIRMEPLWMGMGQAAGLAAHLVLESKERFHNMNVAKLQRLLLEQGQVIAYFDDLKKDDPAWEAIQYWACRGFFKQYHCRPKDLCLVSVAHRWLEIFDSSIHQIPDSIPSEEQAIETKIDNSSSEELGIAPFLDSIEKMSPEFRERLIKDPSWLYEERGHDQMIMHGEVCMALYRLVRS
ncbi:MAG: FAD-dependent oxidoreductase [Cyclobacteriaceae bacterium]|nr:FAD-dependent oxidoreductase [Cyclobacteriaceae bacterium]